MNLSTARIRIESPETIGEVAFYKELTTRNRHFIAAEVQRKISKIKVLVAGCGAAGGACTASLARLGVTDFVLADNGDYELNNLNRQHAGTQDIGRNKATVQAELIRSINPFAKISVHTSGITHENAADVVRWADFVVDAVDVTNEASMKMKLELHRIAHRARKPVICPLDLGFCQWGQAFDYRDPKVLPVGGKLEQAMASKHPIKALLSYVPLTAIPPHVLPLLIDVLSDGRTPASQLGCASDLLSAIVVAAVTRFADSGQLIDGWNVNLEELAIPLAKRLRFRAEAPLLRRRIKKLLQQC